LTRPVGGGVACAAGRCPLVAGNGVAAAWRLGVTSRAGLDPSLPPTALLTNYPSPRRGCPLGGGPGEGSRPPSAQALRRRRQIDRSQRVDDARAVEAVAGGVTGAGGVVPRAERGVSERVGGGAGGRGGAADEDRFNLAGSIVIVAGVRNESRIRLPCWLTISATTPVACGAAIEVPCKY